MKMNIGQTILRSSIWGVLFFVGATAIWLMSGLEDPAALKEQNTGMFLGAFAGVMSMALGQYCLVLKKEK